MLTMAETYNESTTSLSDAAIILLPAVSTAASALPSHTPWLTPVSQKTEHGNSSRLLLGRSDFSSVRRVVDSHAYPLLVMSLDPTLRRLDVQWFGHRSGPMHLHQILLGLVSKPPTILRAFEETPGLVLAYAVSFFSPFSLSPDRTFWAPYIPLGWMALAILLVAFLLLRRSSIPILIAGSLCALYPLLLPAAIGVRSIGALSDRYVFFPFLFLTMAVIATIQWVSTKPAKTRWSAPFVLKMASSVPSMPIG
jgi:hypothetical protein